MISSVQTALPSIRVLMVLGVMLITSGLAWCTTSNPNCTGWQYVDLPCVVDGHGEALTELVGNCGGPYSVATFSAVLEGTFFKTENCSCGEIDLGITRVGECKVRVGLDEGAEWSGATVNCTCGSNRKEFGPDEAACCDGAPDCVPSGSCSSWCIGLSVHVCLT